VLIALLLMLLGIFETLETVLSVYSNVAIAWIGAIVADLVVLKPLRISPPFIEFKRAHLHANGLGTSALAMILLLACLTAAARTKAIVALAAGVGGLGYAVYWLLAGLRAPGLGSTGKAKASLEWLAVPTSGLCILALAAVLVLLVRQMTTARDA